MNHLIDRRFEDADMTHSISESDQLFPGMLCPGLPTLRKVIIIQTFVQGYRILATTGIKQGHVVRRSRPRCRSLAVTVRGTPERYHCVAILTPTRHHQIKGSSIYLIAFNQYPATCRLLLCRARRP
jgi:hypothetical protein